MTDWTNEEREAVREEISGMVMGAGYYSHSVGPDDAWDITKAALAALAPHVEARVRAAKADMEGRALAAEAARDGYRQEVERLRVELGCKEVSIAAHQSGVSLAAMEVERLRPLLAERDTTIARVEALADEWDEVADKWPYAHWHDSQKANAARLRAALAGGSDG